MLDGIKGVLGRIEAIEGQIQELKTVKQNIQKNSAFSQMLEKEQGTIREEKGYDKAGDKVNNQQLRPTLETILGLSGLNGGKSSFGVEGSNVDMAARLLESFKKIDDN